MKNREELIQDLTQTIKVLKKFSCPDFNNVFSQQYYNTIISKKFSDNSDNYSYIFGDFNKLSKINNIYGHNFGDIALKTALKLIQLSLPSNAIISRLGGDEFSIILPNVDKNTCDEYINKINNTLTANSTFIAGLTIELCGADSSSGNFDELYKITEKEVSDKKAARKELDKSVDVLLGEFLPLDFPKNLSSEKDIETWTTLNRLINVSIYNFLQNIRLSDNAKIEPQQINDSSHYILNSFHSLLNEKSNNNTIENHIEPTSAKNNLEDSHLVIDKKTASIIHNLITHSEINLDVLSTEGLKQLSDTVNQLLNILIRDRNCDLLSKFYFRLYLANELSKSDKPYQAVYFSTTGIKISNTAYDHTFTDSRLKRTSDILVATFSKYLDFNNDAFCNSDDDIYFVSQSGGNYLALIPQDKAINQDTLNKIIASVNNFVDIKNPNSSFYVAGAIKNEIEKSNPSEFILQVRSLKEQANKNKDSLKKNLFNSIDVENCFKKSINNCIDYYLENVPNAKEDISTISIISNNIFKSLLNHSASQNRKINSDDLEL